MRLLREVVCAAQDSQGEGGSLEFLCEAVSAAQPDSVLTVPRRECANLMCLEVSLWVGIVAPTFLLPFYGVSVVVNFHMKVCSVVFLDSTVCSF